MNIRGRNIDDNNECLKISHSVMKESTGFQALIISQADMNMGSVMNQAIVGMFARNGSLNEMR